MRRRRAYASLGAVVVACAALLLPAAAADSHPPLASTVDRPPNIIVILADDMREDDLRYMPWTRRLLAARGVQFHNSFSPNPLCCPARASALTGQYSHNHRVYDVRPPYGYHAFDDHNTLATWLSTAGYETIYVGKYLNGYGVQPPYGAVSGTSLYYVPPGWTMWRASFDRGSFPPGDPEAGSTYDYFDTTLSDNGRGFLPLEGTYQTLAYGDMTERLIRARAGSAQPYFLYMNYVAPHGGTPRERDDPGTFTLPNGERKNYDTPARPRHVRGIFDGRITQSPGQSWQDPDISDQPLFIRRSGPLSQQDWKDLLEVTQQRAESLYLLDLQVLRTIRTLADVGELDQTIVMFASDNGYFLGEELRRQGKVFPYEPALRVPMIVRGPGIPQGQERFDPVSMVDLGPTIAAFAGATPVGTVDGVSFADTARQGDQGWTRGILVESRPVGRLVRQTDEAGNPLQPGGTADVRFMIGVRTNRFLYLDLATGEKALYDLEVDPKEYDNVVDDPAYASFRAQLEDVLSRLRACAGETCREPLPESLAAHW